MAFNWDERALEVLRSMWAAGRTATQIMATLNAGQPAEYFVTRNAVIGKAHRMSLTKRADPIIRTGKPARKPSWEKPKTEAQKAAYRRGAQASQSARKLNAAMQMASGDASPPQAPRAIAPPERSVGRPAEPMRSYTPSAEASERLAKELATKACKYPIGDPRQAGFHFCGAKPVVIGKPYCAAHCAICYVKPGMRAGDYSDGPPADLSKRVA